MQSEKFVWKKLKLDRDTIRVAADAEVPVSVRKKAPASWSSHIST